MTKSIDKPIDRFSLVKGKKIKQVNFTERVLLECSLTFLTNSKISDEYKIDDDTMKPVSDGKMVLSNLGCDRC
jgi:hypothetical protein